MLDRNTLRWLATPEGQELIDQAANDDQPLHTRISRLRRSAPPDLAAGALEQAELRRRAAIRFAHAHSMLFTRDGLEQSSGERIAAWRAGQIPPGLPLVDLCCGIGGDSAFLARRGPLLAIDRDPAAAYCAAHNITVAGDSCARVLCADATHLPLDRLSPGTVAFFDPSRRAGGRRVRSAEEFAPPLSFAESVRRSIPGLCVKLSPALPDYSLDHPDAALEFVSDRGECKEAVQWFGILREARGLGPGRRAATVLSGPHTLIAAGVSIDPPVGPPAAWLLEPDPAVIRAHLLGELAAILGASAVDSQTAYLTSAQKPSGEGAEFTAAYRIIEWFPFSLAEIQRRLRALRARATAVKRRGAPFEPDDILRRLKPGGDRPVVAVIGRVTGRPAAFLCEPRSVA